jgi:hypothetical protein
MSDISSKDSTKNLNCCKIIIYTCLIRSRDVKGYYFDGFYYIRIYIKLLFFLFKIRLVKEFEPDKLLQFDNYPDRNPAPELGA